MSTTTHTRSIHIDAPVEKVFEHVEDPKNFYAAMAATSPQDPPRLLDVDLKQTYDSIRRNSSFKVLVLGGGEDAGDPRDQRRRRPRPRWRQLRPRDPNHRQGRGDVSPFCSTTPGRACS